MVVGKATRLSQFFLNHDRGYEATIQCGQETSTYDSEGEPVGELQKPSLTAEEVTSAVASFQGRFPQTPPPVSAKKIGGVPAYKLARSNQPLELEPVEIEIYEIEAFDIQPDRFGLRLRCSKGTYVRSLAHDLGIRFGCGAHVSALRRTSMGEFDISSAHSLEALEALRDEGRLEEALLSPTALLPEMPVQRVDAVDAARILHGRDFRVTAPVGRAPAKRVKAISPDGRLVAIGEIRLPTLYHPIVVF
jgi:tRNA pseudouridine55 synthase